MTENTKYLDELLLSYKQTIYELKQSNRDLKDIIDKLLHNHKNVANQCDNGIDEINDVIDSECDDNDDDSDSEEENRNENEIVFVNQSSINSQTLQDIFKIVDEYNQSRCVKSFPSYEYFKTKGITRYMISKENGLKTLRKKYFESRTFT